MHTVIETDAFRRAAKEAGASESEVSGIIDAVAANPEIGDLIPGSGGARKFRFAREGAGKRGGYRVISYFAADDVPAFLLDIYSKNVVTSITQAQQNKLAKELSALADNYRARVKAEAARKRKGVRA